ncbi:MAG: diacylglycerol kinase [Proteobacteria bacterium]|nr:diacylglycerol kinase [Pseudomonadota bacterium]
MTDFFIGRVKAFGYSLAGLKSAFSNDIAFVIEVVCAVILTPVALLIPVPFVFKALLISSLLLVLMTELINSAIETVVDRISLERNVLSKRAKDIGSAAVLLSLVNASVVWGMALWSLKAYWD